MLEESFGYLCKNFETLKETFAVSDKIIEGGRGMLQFTLGFIIGLTLGVLVMCLMFIASQGPEPPGE